MTDWGSHVERMADIFFNGRAATPQHSKPSVTIDELIRRKTSHITVDGKMYRVTVERVELEKR